MALYPKANEGRLRASDPVLAKLRRKFLLVTTKNFTVLLILFLSLYCWIFGALYQQESHIHNLTIGFVDYDGGAVGAAFRTAAAGLQGQTYPVIAEYPPSEFPAPSDLEAAVCSIDFWATIYIAPGASDRLSAGLSGSTPASSFNRSDIVTYTWNEVRYPTIVDADVSANLQELSNAARILYTTGNATRASLNVTNPDVLPILVNPWTLVSVNIQPTTQGPRVIYNTIVIVLVLVQEFFYLGILNGIYGHLKIWGKAKPKFIVCVRIVNSVVYSFLSSLCLTGAIWAFRAGWNVDGGQFMLTWMTFWLLGSLNFFVLDIFTVWSPPPFVPMFLITWVIFNVASIVTPLELVPGFFKIGYVFPAHAAYQVLLDIWSRGCNPQLPYALPTLFAWELVAVVGSSIGVYRRAHYAKVAEEGEAKALREKVCALMEFEHSQKALRQQQQQQQQQETGQEIGGAEAKIERPSTGNEYSEDESTEEAELAKVISRVDLQTQRESMRSQALAPLNYALQLPFSASDDEDGCDNIETKR